MAFVKDELSGSEFKFKILIPVSENFLISGCFKEIIGDASYPVPNPVAFTFDTAPICDTPKPKASIKVFATLAVVLPCKPNSVEFNVTN